MKKATGNYAILLGGTAVLLGAVAAQGQVIDTFNNDGLAAYTATAVLENSDGAGSGLSFSDTSGALTVSFSGTISDPEQALLLAPTASIAPSFVVGQMLVINTSVPVSSTTEDFGLAISSTATPTAAGSGNGFNSRTTFDWASISIRPSQGSVRINTSISGTLNTAFNTAVASSTVTQLFIEWVSADSFTLGYNTASGTVVEETVNFNSTSTIGAAIGVYGDVRVTGTSLGSFSDLAVEPAPEPCTAGLLGLGGILIAMRMRRNK